MPRFLTIVFLIISFSVHAQSYSKKLAKGISLYNNHELQLSLIEFLNSNPSSYYEQDLMHMYIARIHYDLKNYDLCVKELNENGVNFPTLKALAYLNMDSLQQAKKIALLNNLNVNDTLLYVMAESHFIDKKYDDATFYFTKIHRNFSFNYLVDWGLSCYHIGDYMKALALFENELEINKYNKEIHNYIGLCYQHLSNFDKAIRNFKNAYGQDAKLNSLVSVNLGTIYQQIEEPDSAILAHEYAIKCDSSRVDAYYNLALMYYDIKNFNKSSFYLNKLLEIDPKYSFAYEKLANSYYQEGQFEKAIEKYRQSTFFSVDDPNYYNLIGVSYLQVNDPDKAIPYFEEALVKAPNYAISYYNLAGIYFNKDDYQTSLSYCMYALQYLPQDDDVLFLLAKNYLQIQDLENSKFYFETVLRINPLRPNTYLYLADIALIQNEKYKADFYYKMFNVMKPNDYDGLYYCGVNQYNLEEFSTALYNLQKAQQANNTEEVQLALAKTFYQLGNYNSALVMCNELLATHPSNAKAYLTLSLAHKKLHNKKEAKYFEQLAYLYDQEIEKYIF